MTPKAERLPCRWRLPSRVLDLGDRTLLMGVLNVTPDSFSDGGRYVDASAALAHATRMIEDGADIIDVGGESTRPGSDPVSLDEEMRRILPIVRAIRSAHPGAIISIDTTKAAVADAACGEGADIINDTSAMGDDAGMPLVAARHGVGVVLMHRGGPPKTMQDQPVYGNVVEEVGEHLRRRIADVQAAGVAAEAICIDPGIGFGKTVEHNLELLNSLPGFVDLGRPVLVGLSRKRFLGAITGLAVQDRLAPSLAGLTYAILQGAHVLRVHDVKESCAAARMADMFRRKASPCIS